MDLIRKILSVFSPLTAAGGVGVCPVCVAVSASVLTWLGLAAFIPIWRPIAFSLLGLGVIGFVLDWRKHRNFLPLVLIVIGGVLLYIGRYVWGGPEFSGWPIWGPGAALVIAAVVLNRRLFRAKAHIHQGSPSTRFAGSAFVATLASPKPTAESGSAKEAASAQPRLDVLARRARRVNSGTKNYSPSEGRRSTSPAEVEGFSSELFTCPECDLKYREKEWALKCERWCKEHKSCNLEIIKRAVKDAE